MSSLETPNRLHAAAVIRVDFNVSPETVQLINSNNFSEIAYTPGGEPNSVYLPFVREIDPSIAAISLMELEGSTAAFLTPTPVPTGNPDIDNLPNSAVLTLLNTVGVAEFASLAVWELEVGVGNLLLGGEE